MVSATVTVSHPFRYLLQYLLCNVSHFKLNFNWVRWNDFPFHVHSHVHDDMLDLKFNFDITLPFVIFGLPFILLIFRANGKRASADENQSIACWCCVCKEGQFTTFIVLLSGKKGLKITHSTKIFSLSFHISFDINYGPFHFTHHQMTLFFALYRRFSIHLGHLLKLIEWEGVFWFPFCCYWKFHFISSYFRKFSLSSYHRNR